MKKLKMLFFVCLLAQTAVYGGEIRPQEKEWTESCEKHKKYKDPRCCCPNYLKAFGAAANEEEVLEHFYIPSCVGWPEDNVALVFDEQLARAGRGINFHPNIDNATFFVTCPGLYCIQVCGTASSTVITNPSSLNVVSPVIKVFRDCNIQLPNYVSEIPILTGSFPAGGSGMLRLTGTFCLLVPFRVDFASNECPVPIRLVLDFSGAPEEIVLENIQYTINIERKASLKCSTDNICFEPLEGISSI